MPKRAAGLRRAIRAYHEARLFEELPAPAAPWRLWLLGCVLTAALLGLLHALWLGARPAPLPELAAPSLKVSVRVPPVAAEIAAVPTPPEPKVAAPVTASDKKVTQKEPVETRVLVQSRRRSLAASRAAAMADWQPALPDPGPTAAGKRVFNPALAARLDQIAAPVTRGTEALALGPDAFGRQAVIIGDRCFQVQKLDDQALRGMAAWEPVDCRPGQRGPGIRLGKLRGD